MTKSNIYKIPNLPLPYDLETKSILRQLNLANRSLAELKGLAMTIPNENILIDCLTLQEAKGSSEVENIVTTHDALFRADLNLKQTIIDASTKEVQNYRQAMKKGFFLVRKDRLLTNNIIKEIQSELEMNTAGFRTAPGTSLRNDRDEVVYIPPQDSREIVRMMNNLERFINEKEMSSMDPLIKIAIIHHQFESIHPFYDGNGRTGRIIVILYLIVSNLLDLPILYLSRYITQNKAEYYRLLQDVRDKGDDNLQEWENWILFMLKGIEETSIETIRLVKGISTLMNDYKQRLRPLFGKQYRHELLNNLFFHPYTKIEFIERDMMVNRITASKYLQRIVDAGLLSKIRYGTTNYYINTPLIELFMGHTDASIADSELFESIKTTLNP